MITTISGTYKDSIGLAIAGHYIKNRKFPLEGPFSAIAWIKDDKMIGQAIFTSYNDSNIDIHLYAPRCFCKRTIKEVYTYVFKHLKCNRLTARLDASDDKLSHLLPRIGFEYKYTDEGYYGEPGKPVDALVYVLTSKNAQRWIK